ncbi:MAG: hypothetical protein PVH61_07750 [Candidatus Aminicenantes bacterium]|jgi:hypothetical protein
MAEVKVQETAEAVSVKVTPQIEAAIAEVAKTIPKLTAESSKAVVAGVLGVAVCCNG